jgi:transposase-like protein
VENVSALVAYGIGLDGHRQLLAVTIGTEESEGSWSELLGQVAERGLSGVQLVVADAHAGLAAAVRKHLPEAALQRCTVHLLRNVLTKAPQRLRGRLAREVSKVFEASSKAQARERVEVLRAGLGKQVPESMKCLDDGFAAATQFYAFPRRTDRIRSTNGSSVSTVRSSAGREPSAPFPTAPARSGSSPRSRSRSPRSGPTVAISTCPC